MLVDRNISNEQERPEPLSGAVSFSYLNGIENSLHVLVEMFVIFEML